MNRPAIESHVDWRGNIVRAAEDWSKEYNKEKEIHAKLIRAETKLERVLRNYFRDFANRSDSYIDWFKYAERVASVKAADIAVDVFIEDGPVGFEDKLLVEVIFDPVAEGTQLGFQFGEAVTSRTVGVPLASDIIQRVAMEAVGEMIGMRLDPSGVLVKNPKAKYSITETIRRDIRRSIATSINLGEDQAAASKRMQSIIKNPKRAEVIARTEAVNSFQKGLVELGRQTGAIGKKWQSVNFEDICGENDSQGPIGIDKTFISGDLSPVAHPNCRCGMRLIYEGDPQASQL